MYRFSKIIRTRLQTTKTTSTNNRFLACSQPHNNFFQKLKENIAEDAQKDDKLKEAQRKAKAEMANIGKEFDPMLEKSKKIKEDSMSVSDKKIREMKESFEKSKQQFSEKVGQSEFLKDKMPEGLKFKMKVPKGVDPRQWEQVQQASAAAELQKILSIFKKY